MHAASAESPERAAAHRWRWMLGGGKVPELDSLNEVGYRTLYLLQYACMPNCHSKIWKALSKTLCSYPSHTPDMTMLFCTEAPARQEQLQ